MLLKLRDVKFCDCKELWEWRNDKRVRKWCFNAGNISYNEHKIWFNEQINDPNMRIYIFENEDGAKVGQVRMRIKNKEAHININLNPLFFDKGIGSRLIKMASDFLFKIINVEKITAEVLINNLASRKAFEKAGYQLVSENKKIKVFVYKNE